MKKINHWTIDSAYFKSEVNTYLNENGVKPEDVISISESNGFTTIWYWTY